MTKPKDVKDIVLDDSGLLLDRVLRSLHRNLDGHLSATSRNHVETIEGNHNVAIVYFYTYEHPFHTLHQHYIYSYDSRNYSDWFRVVEQELKRIYANKPEHFAGFFGWMTNHLQITPLRTGDLFIKIDNSGAHGVRLAFGPSKVKRTAHNEKAKAKRKNAGNRLR